MKKYKYLLLLLTTTLFLAGATSHIKNPYAISNYHFKVLVNGGDAGVFSEVSGLYIEQQAVGYLNSDDDVLARKRPSTVTYSNLTFKKEYTGVSLFCDWIEGAHLIADDDKFKDITVLLYKVQENGDSTQIKRWCFIECFPVSWKLSPLKNGPDREVLTEEIVVAVNWYE